MNLLEHHRTRVEILETALALSKVCSNGDAEKNAFRDFFLEHFPVIYPERMIVVETNDRSLILISPDSLKENMVYFEGDEFRIKNAWAFSATASEEQKKEYRIDAELLNDNILARIEIEKRICKTIEKSRQK